ncbi:hypothetical protein LCGC14_1252160 [marine sediment metagenome]|uniref:Uncharacterized protein n=1 Tax=marine sediment metagenome TaxID=412755 RepID=A0A0F9L642_9ZZZZ
MNDSRKQRKDARRQDITRRFKSSLIVGMSLALLWVMLTIKVTGKYHYEPDSLILNSELALLGLILLYGFWTWLKGR